MHGIFSQIEIWIFEKCSAHFAGWLPQFIFIFTILLKAFTPRLDFGQRAGGSMKIDLEISDFEEFIAVPQIGSACQQLNA